MPADLEVEPASDHPAQVQQRKRQARGLLFLALTVLIASILRAGVHRVFTVGWWRLW